MILTQEIINKYINAKADAWADSTMKSERARLTALIGQDLSNAPKLYQYLSSKYAPYTVKTVFIRLSELQPELKTFLQTKKKLFKNVYKRETLDIDFASVKDRISKILDPDVRKTAEGLLSSGLRANEILRLEGDQVIGKGNKPRSYFGSQPIVPISYTRLYRGLRKVGLKPHTLRKIFATKLAEAGFKPQDLCQVLGWSSFETAKFYLQPKSNTELKENIALAIGIK